LNNSFVSQGLKAATVTNLPAVSKKPNIDTSRGACILPQKVILSPSNSRDRAEQIPSPKNFQDYTTSETPLPLRRGSVMKEIIPGTLYDHLKTFLKKHTDNHQSKSKKMNEKPPRSKEESKAKMSAVKLYYPQPLTQRTSRDSSSQAVKKSEKMIVDQREEEIIKARMRDSLLKNLLDTIAKASKTDIQNTHNITNESEKVLLRERIPSSSYGEENNKKRKGRLLLEQK